MKKKKNCTDIYLPKEEPAFLQQYRTCYPRTRRFYMTSDRMIFRDDLQAAATHQKCLNKGKLITYFK